MSRTLPLVVVLALSTSALYPAAQACGDKFLMVGRGAKFQRAYASVYPGRSSSTRGHRVIPRQVSATCSCTKRCARPVTPSRSSKTGRCSSRR